MSDFTLDVRELTDYALGLKAVSRVGARTFGKITTKWRDEAIREAKRIVPVRTGALKRSIVPGRTKESRVTIDGSILVTEPYAGFVEFGTSNMAPQPYIRPALNKVRGPFIDELRDAATETLRPSRIQNIRRFGQ